MSKRKLFKTLFLVVVFVFTVTRLESVYTSFVADKESSNNPHDIGENTLNISSSGSRGNAEITANIDANTNINLNPAADINNTELPSETIQPEQSNEDTQTSDTTSEVPNEQTDGLTSEPPAQQPDEQNQPSETPDETPYEPHSESPDEQSTETQQPTESPVTEPPATEPPVTESPVKSPYYADSEYGSPVENGVLSNKKMAWSFNPNSDFQPPTTQRDFDIRPFSAYYLGNIYEKAVYLTFDEGYENGYTPLILDVLKEKNVKAAFFVTKSYISRNQPLIRQMIEEGHIVGNHSVNHKSSPDLTDEEFLYELEETARYFEEITGTNMPKYFRPPMGEYSARTLQLTEDLGYKSIFWSFAYRDWLTDDQPTTQAAFNAITARMHNGCILLLHAVSEANTNALPSVIDDLRLKGYTFKTLDDL